MLKNPGGALRAFIGAGFCAVILSLSACASKGAADIPIGGIINVGGGETPRELGDLPALPASNTETLSGLDDLADFMRLDASAIRDGGDSTVFGLTGGRYNFIDSSVIVQQLEHAYLGVWMDGDVADNTLRYRYANLNDNMLATLPTTSTPTATYNVEVDAFFDRLRFYPDGMLIANFANGTLSGTLSANGAAATVDNHFGVGATLPDGTFPDSGDELSLVVTLDPNSISNGAFSIGLTAFPTRGFFAPLDAGTGTFVGRFHDDADYDETAAPDELSGTFTYTGNLGAEITGGFLGRIQP